MQAAADMVQRGVPAQWVVDNGLMNSLRAALSATKVRQNAMHGVSLVQLSNVNPGSLSLP